MAEARRGFKTKVFASERKKQPVDRPPPNGELRLIRYSSPVGELAAYVSHDPKDGKKHPAIVWMTGGDCNTIDEGCWREGTRGINFLASEYRKNGILTMFPSLCGGNDNPGLKEGFLGEVDDVLAAADYLSTQPFVDPNRIYLGGHSTGGTLVLLTAECTERFRAVFSFGPIEDVVLYGAAMNPFPLSDPQELRVRSPQRWLHSVRSPTFVIEGVKGNREAIQALAKRSKNPKVDFIEVGGADHFTVLGPANEVIAKKVAADVDQQCNLSFTAEEFEKSRPK
ncbi:MAG: prolyl oligopeptidase family serine peptidase [Gemmataceae bacterium]|nr:prolyl oligopeptidase family serine peptidase [Gemmataceae bacterium]